MLKAQNVAEYILSKTSPEDGDTISHLKMQKLLYYCQGFHLAIKDAPLFREKISHWDHGPVVEEVYHVYKQHANQALPLPENFDESIIPVNSRLIIDEVLEVYAGFTASQLRNMTHQEPPWINTDDCKEITHETLSSYFKTQLTLQ